MSKNHILFFILMILQSCQSAPSIDNKEIIDSIDLLDFTKTIYEVSVDDNENILDTLSIEKIKKDKNEIVRYTLLEKWEKDRKITNESYYRTDGDLFFQVFNTNNDFKIIYETFIEKDDIIDKAKMITMQPEKSDTIHMKFDYTYNLQGKKESLSITSMRDTISSVSFLKFNENEKTEFQYMIYDADTIEKSNMKYRDGNVIQSTHEYKNSFKIEIYDYDESEKLKFKNTFKKVNDSLIKSSEYIYENDRQGNLDKITIKDFENDTILKRMLITVMEK